MTTFNDYALFRENNSRTTMNIDIKQASSILYMADAFMSEGGNPDRSLLIAIFHTFPELVAQKDDDGSYEHFELMQYAGIAGRPVNRFQK